MKKSAIALGLVVITALTWRLLPTGSAEPPQAFAGMGPATVSVAPVLSRQVTEQRDYSGRLQAVEQAEIKPRVEGTIDTVHFTEGALVQKGDLLFTLDPRPFEAAVKRAEAMLASAQAQAGFTQKDFQRVAALGRDDVVTRRDIDARRNAANVAQADVAAAEAALRTAKLDLDYTQIKAPISGRASRAEMTAGNLVQTMTGAPLLTTIVSVDPIYVDFSMDEPTYLEYVRAGMTAPDKAQTIAVDVTLAGDGKTVYHGKVKLFDNQIKVDSGTIRVRAVLGNPEGKLVPGMYALARIAVPSQGETLLVTDRAISTDQDKKYVLVVGPDNVANYRPVQLGGTADGLRIVKDGLKAGEKIVVNGVQMAIPGMPVTPLEVAMDAPPPANPAQQPVAGDKTGVSAEVAPTAQEVTSPDAPAKP